MCIVLISTAHPSYPLILINNRDEFLSRPTAPASWWPTPHKHVLGGRDLLRSAQGTWLGVTRDGRIAVLTNFRDEDPQDDAPVSRGEMVNAFLKASASDVRDTGRFARELAEGTRARGSGGFTLVCGRMGESLAVVSNRMQKEGDVEWVAGQEGETVGLSNAAFGNQGWKKVVEGEKRLKELLADCVRDGSDKESLMERLGRLLSLDTLPKRGEGDSWESTVQSLRSSIFIPKIGDEDVNETAESEHKLSDEKGTSGAYGTQKQSVVLLDREGNVTFVEKTLYDNEGRDVKNSVDSVQRFEFRIQDD